MRQPLITPAPLHPGDTIGIVAPAGQCHDESSFAKGIAILREMGFETRFPRRLWPGTSYLADSDTNRCSEFIQMVKNPEIKCIMAMRGGFGCLRILQGLDPGVLRNNPKKIVGFSDISLLLNYIAVGAKMSTLHGPTVTSLHTSTPAAIESLYQSLVRENHPDIEIPRLEILKGGNAKAPLVGGNLATLTTVLGTPFDMDYSGCILFLEDVNEPLYKLDRVITQFRLAGKFENLAGLILGNFSFSTALDDIEQLRYREAVWQLILDACQTKNFPVWGNFPVGHVSGNYTIPIGTPAFMDANSKKLRFPMKI